MENQMLQIPPKNWLVQSILVTIFCCLPFGIAGIIYALKVDSLFRSGNVEAANEAAAQAAKWTKIGFFVGIIWLVICVVLRFTGALFNGWM